MAKNFFNRYVWLIDLINRHGYISFQEINRAWCFSKLNKEGGNLSERTFFNHKDAILDTFGIEIQCDRTLGYHIANGSGLQGDGLRNWLLQSISLNNILNESSDMRDRILFEPVPSSQGYLTEIISAMRDGKMIGLTYQSFNRPEPYSFVVAPYCLKIFKQRWYMLAKSEEYERPRIYALDRIHGMEEMEEAFELPKDFDAESFFGDYFGIIIGDGADVEDVKLKVRADQVKYYRTLPLHHSQKEVETTDEFSVFQYRIATTFDFCQEILSKGDSVEVLEPAVFRDWVAETARKMNEKYSQCR